MTFQERIDAAMEQIRPALQADGGDIEVLEVREEEGLVLVAFSGACGGCPMRNLTLKNYVEKELRQAVPGVQEVRLG